MVSANGIITADKVVIMHIVGLNAGVPIYVLDKCPPVLSVGRLKRDRGCRFELAIGDDKALLTLPTGKVIDLSVRCASPYLEQNSTMTFTSEGAAAPLTEGGSTSLGEPSTGLDARLSVAHLSDAAPPTVTEVPAPPAPHPEVAEREGKEAWLRREAKSLLHQMSHLLKKPIARSVTRPK